MPVVAAQTALVNEDSAVRLARYAAIISYPECNFFGVNADVATGFQCREIWTKDQRDMVLKYLAEAQYEIEKEVGYPLAPRYIGLNQSEEYQDWQEFKPRIVTRFARFIEAGIEATSNIAIGSVVSHLTDPAVVGPIATTVTNQDEIHVYHPGTDIEIDPSQIVIAGGTVTIYIPRCRMVTQAMADNPDTGIDYNTVANFEATVDVRRIYTDTTTQATLVYPKSCAGCDEETVAGCIYVRNKRVGIIDLNFASTNGNLCECKPQLVKLHYKAGADVLTRQAEDAIVRLAHAKMPSEPCGCDVIKRLWGRDTNVPEVLTRERLNCPFGLSNGAWTAWKFAQSMKVMRGSTL